MARYTVGGPVNPAVLPKGHGRWYVYDTKYRAQTGGTSKTKAAAGKRARALNAKHEKAVKAERDRAAKRR